MDSGWSSSLEASYSTVLNVFFCCLAAILRSAFSSFLRSTLDSTLRALAASRSTPPVATARVDDMLRWVLTWMVWSRRFTVDGPRLSPPLASVYLSTHFSTSCLILFSRAASTLPEAEMSSSVTVAAASLRGDRPEGSSSSDQAVEAWDR